MTLLSKSSYLCHLSFIQSPHEDKHQALNLASAQLYCNTQRGVSNCLTPFYIFLLKQTASASSVWGPVATAVCRKQFPSLKSYTLSFGLQSSFFSTLWTSFVTLCYPQLAKPRFGNTMFTKHHSINSQQVNNAVGISGYAQKKAVFGK